MIHLHREVRAKFDGHLAKSNVISIKPPADYVSSGVIFIPNLFHALVILQAGMKDAVTGPIVPGKLIFLTSPMSAVSPSADSLQIRYRYPSLVLMSLISPQKPQHYSNPVFVS